MSNTTSDALSGGCLCGAVRFIIDAQPVFSANCHCRDCQRATGSAYMPVLAVPRDHVVISGDVTWFERRADSGAVAAESFCPRCGARLFAHAEVLPGLLIIQAGNLDEPARFRPQFDMFVDSAQPWDVLDPELPKYPRMPPLAP